MLISAVAGRNLATIQYLIDLGADVQSAGPTNTNSTGFADMAKDALYLSPTRLVNIISPVHDSSDLRPLDVLIAPHVSMFQPNFTGLRGFADCLTLLLQHGAEPWLPVHVPFVWYKDIGWWHGQRGFLRHEEVIKEYPELAATYFHAIHMFYPEAVVDSDGEVFWDTLSAIEGTPSGSSYLSVVGTHEAEDKCPSCQARTLAQQLASSKTTLSRLRLCTLDLAY